MYIEKIGMTWEKKWIRRPLEQHEEFPLMIKYAGAARWPEGTEIIRHNSDLFAIEYVCAGNAILVQDNNRYVINKGSVFLLRKHVDHLYKTGPEGILYKRYVTIDGYDLDNLLRYFRFFDKDYIILKETKPVNDLLKRCTTLLENFPARDLSIELSVIAYQLLLVLSNSIRSRFPTSIRRILEFMHTNLHLQISRKEICDYIGMSPVSLNRIFRKYLHCPAMAYFMDMKMQWAQNLLKSTGMSIKEITYRIGMDNPFYFSSLFKKHFGVSPKTYREL